jgi:hypothetical protein
VKFRATITTDGIVNFEIDPEDIADAYGLPVEMLDEQKILDAAVDEFYERIYDSTINVSIERIE